MAIVFKNAPLVSSGSVPLASHMIGLAEAFNTRLKSGLADCTKRIHQYAFNLVRQIRLPADEFTFPSLGEFPMFYQMLDFDQTAATWPIAEQGEPEGANIASPAAQFVFGVGDEENGTPGEGDYFTTYDFFNPTGTTPEDYWTLAKYQRGAIDPSTGAQWVPMFDLAQRHFRLTFPDWSRHHKAPGGFLPTIRQAERDCTYMTLAGEKWETPSYIYKFKPLVEGKEPYTGSGTCGPDRWVTQNISVTGGQSTDIEWVADYPFAWYVKQYDGAIYRFYKNEYLLVRDGGGVLSREDGGQIQRLMINPFIADFRGTEEQRSQVCFETRYIDYAFANQDFYTTQYQLAPASGSENGEVIEDIYPYLHLTTNQSSGSTHTVTSINSGFRLAGHLIKQNKLSSNVEVQILQGEDIVHTFTINTRSGSAVETFLNGPTSGEIKYRFASTASFTDPAGYIYLEQSVLQDYKPEIWDGYAVIRMSSALGAIGDGQMDQRGIDTDYSRAIYDTYRSYGCFTNQQGAVAVEQQHAAVNTNPVFDAMRKYVNSYIRTVNGTDLQIPSRPMVVGYETSCSFLTMVDGTGSNPVTQSILYFNRYMSGLGLNTNNLDCFVGMVNPENSASNGIVVTASMQGYTNEWVMELCGKPYGSSENSTFKPEVYANYYPYINRCHLRPDVFEVDPVFGRDMYQFFQENSDLTAGDLRGKLWAPESLTAYTYHQGQYARNPLNKRLYDDPSDENGQTAEKFYKSCQVYPKPYEIQSVTVQPGDIVKVVFKSRFQHTEEAPTIISNNVAAWDFNTVKAEPYRTDENIVRLFLLKTYNDANNPQAGIGDNSINSTLPFEPDNPYASIYPTFFFTKLIPKPFANDGIENTGSLDYSGSLPRAYDLQLCETYLRSMCEGFVDETLSTVDACESDFSTDYDYTYSNLCNDAFGRSWVSAITGSIRSDYPLTYGPLPDMEMNTQVFNQIASAVNKLTKVRIPLPFKVRAKRRTYSDSVPLEPTWPGGESSCNRDGFDRAIQFSFVPADAATLVEEGEWYDAGAGETVSTGIQISCNGSQYVANTVRTTMELSFEATDPLSWYALNEELRPMASGSEQSAAIFVKDTSTTKVVDMELTAEPAGCGDQENWWYDEDSALYYADVALPQEESNCTYYDAGVELDAGQIGSTDIAVGSIPGPSVGNRVTCDSLPYVSKELTVVNTRHLIINVPTEN